MADRTTATERVRAAVRRCIAAEAPAGPLLIAVSGGADSLTLASATAAVALDRARAVVIDHGLQPDSAVVAHAAAATVADLGLAVRVQPVQVAAAGGPEAAARDARYAALLADAATDGAALLLGHTRDDQAEQVLLAMARGSGTRSLAGIPATSTRDGVLLLRPLLGITRADTEAACAEAGLSWWADPHNSDNRYARSRLRAVLPLLSGALGDGAIEGLARTAGLARDDAVALDAWADSAWDECRRADAASVTLAVEPLAELPAAIRRRLLRRAALTAGCPAGALTAAHLHRLDAFVASWRGQGEALLPGPVRAWRSYGRLHLAAATSGDPLEEAERGR